MLTYGDRTLTVDDYYIRKLASGLDELIFSLSIWHPDYQLLTEEVRLRDRDQMFYLVKAIDGGNATAKIKCVIDLDEWKSELFIPYTNGSATVVATVASVLPDGWTIDDQSGVTFSRTIELEAPTALEVLDACRNVYNVTFRWDNNNRVVHIVNQRSFEPMGAFFTRELNLQTINYKGKSTDFATRLYATGKDGLTFADINDGKPYVDNFTFSDKVVCAYWSDERYEIKENLLADAILKLEEMAKPAESYTCKIYDLAKVNPERYAYNAIELYDVVTLIDDARNTRVNHQIVEYDEYPHYPERNDIVLSTITPRVSSQIVEITRNLAATASATAANTNQLANVATGGKLTGELAGVSGTFATLSSVNGFLKFLAEYAELNGFTIGETPNGTGILPTATGGTGVVGGGDYYFASMKANSFDNASSIRYKRDVCNLGPVNVDAMRPVYYRLKTDDDTHIGMIAEELADICPEIVCFDADGNPDGIDYGRLAVVAIAEIQKLRKRIKKMEDKRV